MDQLLAFGRLNLEKNVTPSSEEQKALAESQQRFLANQQQYQVLNEQLVQFGEQRRAIEQQQRNVQEKLSTAKAPINEEYRRLRRTHDLKMAALKLGFLVPLLIVAIVLFLKLRSGPYAPAVYALGIAVLLRVGIVMHEYFPARYFKYVLILAALAVVLRVFVYLVRMVAFPKNEWLLRQYREAYEAFLCPICSYPIRRGPLKYLFWTRRSIKKIRAQPAATADGDEPYACPMCSTRVYEACEECGAVRESLLPSCRKCGRVKAVDAAATLDSHGP